MNVQQKRKMVADYLIKRTRSNKNYQKYLENKSEEKDTNKKLSEKAQKLQKMVDDNNFGCQSSVIAKTLSILVGEEIIFTKKNDDKGFRFSDISPKKYSVLIYDDNISLIVCKVIDKYFIDQDNDDIYEVNRYCSDGEIKQMVNSLSINFINDEFHFLFETE